MKSLNQPRYHLTRSSISFVGRAKDFKKFLGELKRYGAEVTQKELCRTAVTNPMELSQLLRHRKGHQ